MSAPAVALPTSVVATPSRPAVARGTGAGEPASGQDGSFDRLIGEPGKPGADAKTEAKSGETDKPTKREADPAESGDAGKPPSDGSAVLAWLQQASVPAPAATPAVAANVATAAVRGIDAGDAKSLFARLAQTVGPGAEKPGAAGLDPASGDGGLELPIFKLPVFSASGNESGKATVSGLEAALGSVLTANGNAGSAVVNALTGNAANASQSAALASLAANVVATSPQVRADAPQTAANALNAAMQTPIDTRSPDLPHQLGERVHWLVGSGTQEARLQLHPADLGLVNVQVKLEGGNASVLFSAEHPAARAALQAALPQLREQFANSGVQLAQAQVSADSPRSGGSFAGSGADGGRRRPSGGTGSAGADGEGEVTAISAPRVVHIGLIDNYA